MKATKQHALALVVVLSVLVFSLSAVAAAPQQYHNFTLTDFDCSVTLTTTAHTGNFTVYMNTNPNMCSETHDGDQSVFVDTFVTEALEVTGLGPGTYSVAVQGLGRYTLERDSFCAFDVTPPTVSLDAIPTHIRGTHQFSADVSDTNSGLNTTACEMCISSDGSCDTEWTHEGTEFVAASQVTNGVCSYAWNTTAVAEGSYLVNVRTRDIQGNLGVGTAKAIIVDNEAPTFGAITIPERVTTNASFEALVAAHDNVEVSLVTLQLSGANYDTTFTLTESGEDVYSVTVPGGLSAGDYTLTLVAYDAANNSVTETLDLRVNEETAFSEELRLTYEDEQSAEPVVTRDFFGNTHVFWQDRRSGSYEVYYTRFDENGLEAYEQTLTALNGSSSVHPDVHLDNSQNLHLVWEDDRDGNDEIYYMKLDSDGAVLVPAKRLTADIFASQKPQISQDSSNNYVVWRQEYAGQVYLRYMILDLDGNVVNAPSTITEEHSAFDVTNDYATYITDGDLYLARLDGSAPLLLGTDVKAHATARHFGDLKVLWQDAQNDLQLTTVTDGVLGGTQELLTAGGSAALSAAVDAFDQLHATITVAGSVDYMRLAADGTVLVDSVPLSSVYSAESAAINALGTGSVDVVWSTQVGGANREIIYVTTQPLDDTAPILSALTPTTIRTSSITLDWTTDERATATIEYGTDASLGTVLNNDSLGTTHTVVLTDLEPATEYYIKRSSRDLFGNVADDDNDGDYYRITTRNTSNQPELPTTLYGLVSYQNGTPAGSVAVTAEWEDADGNPMATNAVSLTETEAVNEGNSTLEGYYRFNVGRIRARTGSFISLSSVGMIGDPLLIAAAAGDVAYNAGTLVIDTEPPVITINSPTDTIYDTPSVNLNFAVSEAVQLAEYSLNGGDRIVATNNIGQNIPLTTQEGNNSLTVYATDLVGHEGQTTVYFFVQDTVPPVAAFNPPSALNDDYLFSADVSDASNSLDPNSCEICVSSDGACNDEWGSATSTFSAGEQSGMCQKTWVVSSLEDGTYYVQFRVADTAGNSAESPLRQVVLDREAPEQVSSLNVTHVPGEGSLQLTWGQTAASDFDHYNVYRSDEDFTSAGAPGAPLPITGQVTGFGDDVDLIATIDDASGTQYTDEGLESDTTYYYAITTVDTAGNELLTVTAVAGTVPDVRPPVITISSPTNQKYNSTHIDAGYSADETTSLCRYTLNDDAPLDGIGFTFTFTGVEGANTLVIACEDEYGNEGSAQVSFTIDTTPPTKVTGVEVRAVPQLDSLDISWEQSGADDFSAYRLYRSDADFTNIADAIRIAELSNKATVLYRDDNLVSQATYYYAVTAIDDAGNEDPIVVAQSGVVAEIIPPDAITGLTATPVAGALQVNLNWDASSASDLSHYAVYRRPIAYDSVEGVTPLTTVAKDATNYADTDVQNAESYYYAVTAIDYAGNENTTVTSVLATVDDIIPPTITLTSPFDGTHYKSKQVPLTFSLSEEASCTYVFNGGAPQSVSPEDSVTLDANEGTNTFQLTCTDTSDNSATANATFTVDTSLPSQITGLTVVHPAGQKQLDLSWDASTEDAFNKYKIYRSSSAFTDASTAQYLGSVSDKEAASYSDTTVESESTYYYAVTQTDLANNENKTVVSVSGSVPDLDPPVVTLLSPEDGAMYNASTQLVDFSVDDANATCKYSINNGTELWIYGPESIFFEEGTNVLEIACTDNAGNRGVDSATFTIDTTPPQSISGLNVATVAGESKLALSWTPSNDAEFAAYHIYRADAAFGDVSAATLITTISNVNQASYDDENLVSGATYHYAVVASDAAGNKNPSVTSVAGVVADTTAPDPITGLSVSTSNSSLTLNLAWNRSDATDFYIYRVYRSESPFVDVASANMIAELYNQDVLFYPDTEVESEHDYYYAITAVDISFNENPNVVSVKGTPPDVIAPVVQITAPIPQTYVDPAVLMTFTVDEEATCAYVLNGGAPVDVGGEQATLSAAEGVNDLTLTCTDVSGNVGSDQVLFTLDTTPPAPVAGVAASNIGGGQVRVSWQYNGEQDVANYAVYRSLSNFNDVGAMTPYGTVASTINEFTDTDVTSDTTYYYAVTAIDTVDNENTAVSTASVTTPDIDPPAKITGLSVDAAIGEYALDLSWDASTAEDFVAYRVYRATSAFSLITSGELIVTINDVSDTTYHDAGHGAQQTYYYAVTAIDEVPNEDASVTSIAGTTAELDPPEITVLEPMDGMHYNNPVRVHWRVDEEPSWCGYSMNGEAEQDLPLIKIECQKYLGGYDFVNNDADPYDDHGHGTHCAGIAAGNGGNIVGVAPDAQLMGYKVLSSGGWGYWSWVIAGIEQAVADGADVMSLSLGGGGNPNDAVSQAVDNAVNAGVVAVVAAGNSGPGSGTIGSPGTARNALTVGAISKAKTIASFSSRGPTSAGTKPDIVAPGVSIYSALPGNSYASWSGTSMATPHVAGVAAILRQAHPEWDAFQVKAAIMNNAEDLGYNANTQGTGMVDMLRIMNEEGIGAPPQDPGAPAPGAPSGEDQTSATYPTVYDPNVAYAPDEKRRIIIELDEESITQKIAAAPPGLSEDSLDTIRDSQKSKIEMAQEAFGEDLNALGLSVTDSYQHVLDAVVTDADQSDIEAIEKMPGVRRVYEDRRVDVSLSQSVPLINADDVWAMNDALGRPLTGRGMKIAIIDTGIDPSHPAFAGADCGYEYETVITAPDGENTFQLMCDDVYNNRGTSSVITFTVDETAPDPITGISAAMVPQTAALDVAWDATGAADFAYYSVYRSTSPFSDVASMTPIETVYDAAQTSYRDESSLASETTYYYAVTATDGAGNVDTQVTTASATVDDLTPPSDVSGVAANVVIGEQALDIVWSPHSAPDLAGYNVYRADTSFTDISAATKIAALDALTTTYYDSGLSVGANYYYAVTAYDTNGNEDASVVSVLGTVDDLIGPEVTIDDPIDGSLYTDATLHVEWHLTEEPGWCGYELNGQPVQDIPLTKVSCQKYLGGYDFINNDADPYDDHGHGTHCAGIAAGNGGNIVGVAPDAQLMGYKVLSAGGSGSWSSVIAGIEQAVEDGADIISLSLGGWGNPNDPASLAVDAAVNAGVVAAVAAGNSGPGSWTILSPGQSRNAITVGAITKSKSIASFSSRGPTSAGTKPDIVAPGVSIYSSLPGNSYASWSGTSMATPHIAGVAALLLQANPEWDAFDVKDAIKNNAEDLGYDGNTQGTGMVDVLRIINNEGISGGAGSASQEDVEPTFDGPDEESESEYAPDEVRRIIVQLDDAPVGDSGTPHSASAHFTVSEAQSSFAGSLDAMGLVVVDSFQTVFNGIVTDADAAQMEQIAALPGVKAVFEDKTVNAIVDDSVPLINADDIWQMFDALGRTITGKGIKIAIIDTGIDGNHPAFEGSDCGFTYEGVFIADEGQNNLIMHCEDLIGHPGASPPVSFEVNSVAPDPITGLVVSTVPGLTALDLSWVASGASDFTQYNIYRSTAPFSDVASATRIDTIATQSTDFYRDSDSSLLSDTLYYYAVTAVDTFGNEDTNVVAVSGRVADLTPPVVTITSPIDSIYATASIVHTFTLSEAATCEYAINGGAPAPATNNMVITGVEGDNSLVLTCTDDDGNVGSDTISFVIDTITPDPITGLTAEYDGHGVLNWDASNDATFAHYNVYRAVSDFTDVSSMAPHAQAPSESYLDFSVASGVTYYYAVTAVDGIQHENTQVTTVSLTIPDTNPPDVITGLSATPDSENGTMLLAFDASSAEDFGEYRVYRSTALFTNIASATQIGTIDSIATTQYLDTSLAQGNYWYAVTAVDTFGNENPSVTSAHGVIDPNVPQVAITYPVANEENLPFIENILFDVTNDFSQITECTYSVDGVFSGSTEGDENLQLSNGVHTITVACTNEGGTVGSQQISFTVDASVNDPVTDLVVELTEDDEVELTWGVPSDDADSFNVYRTVAPPEQEFDSTADLDFYTNEPWSTGGLSEFVDTNVASAVTYHYAVVWVHESALNTTVYPVHITMPETPDPVTGLSVNAIEGEAALALSWSPSDATNLSHYTVYRSNASFVDVADASEVVQVTNASYTDTGLVNGVTYYYAVTATADRESAITGSVAGTVWQPAENQPPSQPLMLSPNGEEYFEPPTDTRIIMSWTQSFDPEGEQVSYILVYEQGNVTTNITTVVGTSSYSWDVSALPEGNYKVAVAATDGESITAYDYSDDTFYLTHTPNEAPAAITGVAVTNDDDTRNLIVSWNAAPEDDFEKYHIYRAQSEFTNVEGMQPVGTLNDQSTTNFEDSSVATYTQYYYAVTAVDDRGKELKNVTSVAGLSGDDVLPEITQTSQVDQYTLGVVNLSASVSDDHSGVHACDVCISTDSSCDDWESAFKNYESGSASGECTYIWDTNGLELDTYYIWFRVSDVAGNSVESNNVTTTVIDQTSELSHTINLVQGWNLISIPFVPESSTLTFLLKDIINEYDKVYHYDASTQNWLIYNPRRTVFDPQNTLFTMGAGKGYWIKMNAPATLEVRGYQAPQYTLPLYQGWNYIGYPSTAAADAEHALEPVLNSINVVYEYVPHENRYLSYEPFGSFNTLTELAPGKGYAVEMLFADNLVVE